MSITGNATAFMVLLSITVRVQSIFSTPGTCLFAWSSRLATSAARLATGDFRSTICALFCSKIYKEYQYIMAKGSSRQKTFNVTDEWPSWAISLTWPSVNSMNLFLWVIGSTSRWLWYIANEPKVDKPINAAYLWKFRLRWSLNINLFSFGKFFHQFRKPLNNRTRFEWSCYIRQN